ncbi:HIT domain-containing protein [Quadrisphaera sp. DSM 44207]|uniref:HIT family protein n=1 Tax=Quadrisphaera sp. DSM 44207 TaxID=1881057 RepID=UPI000885C1A2|nr:HIT domain-containing protein [Quadrisphaera sp. DSM 44207]SDQ48634.1 ATP adenylyltransferase [Quadrisphaera sp. DSM 44207]
MSAPEQAAEQAAEGVEDLAGVPDGYQRLWTPHRMAYLSGQDKPVDEDAGDQCPFCRAPTRPDAESLVVARGELAYVVLNLYPYNSGHLLVCPYRHVAAYADLTPQETVEVATMTQSSLRVLAASSRPQGFNLGMNQGAVGGAGIAAHLHQHVVPRWGGDGNFLPIIARTKALPELLDDARRRLAAAWADSGEPGTTSPG